MHFVWQQSIMDREYSEFVNKMRQLVSQYKEQGNSKEVMDRLQDFFSEEDVEYNLTIEIPPEDHGEYLEGLLGLQMQLQGLGFITSVEFNHDISFIFKSIMERDDLIAQIHKLLERQNMTFWFTLKEKN